ncbi:hypothetical protein FRC09_002810 [Ceratobasidium sp. 395]|nr:hypothetical protein FRC09_002810 [Ceratobasidium sp. 395]
MPPLVVRVGHSSPTESHANPDEFSSDKSVSSIEQAMALSHSDMAIPRATRLETHSVPRNVTAPSGEVSSSVMNSLFIGNFKPSGDDVTSLGIPHQSPTILVTPPVAGSSTGPDTAQSPQRHRHQGVSVSGPKEKKRWFCEPCNSGPFFRKAEFDRHMKTSKAHKRHRSYEPEFQCNKCGRKFTSADAKMGHEKLCESEGKGEERESEGSEE